MYSKTKTKTKLLDTDNRLVVARDKEWGVSETGAGGQKIQTSIYFIYIIYINIYRNHIYININIYIIYIIIYINIYRKYIYIYFITSSYKINQWWGYNVQHSDSS